HPRRAAGIELAIALLGQDAEHVARQILAARLFAIGAAKTEGAIPALPARAVLADDEARLGSLAGVDRRDVVAQTEGAGRQVDVDAARVGRRAALYEGADPLDGNAHGVVAAAGAQFIALVALGRRRGLDITVGRGAASEHVDLPAGAHLLALT